MKKFNKFLKKSLLVLLTCFLVYIISLKNNKVIAQSSFNITISYQKDDVKITKSVEYDTRLKSALLEDYNDSEDGDFYGWTPTTLIDGIYETAFSGWKLVSINGSKINTLYFYPDNDYIYSNDLPFSNYTFSEDTEIILEPMYGKRIYLRDKYNFVNINNIYGDNIATAKIEWDESKKYSYSIAEANQSTIDDIENVGSSYDNPVSELLDAITLLGKKGGEISFTSVT